MARFGREQMPALAGRRAVVTGANGGLGYYTALELARAGAAVILACRNRERAAAAQARMQAEVPDAQLEVMILDAADLDSVRAFVAAFSERFESLDILVNNAGVVMPPLRYTAQGFESQIGTNFLGPFALTGLLLERLQAAPAARIVNIASAAHRGGKLDPDDLNWKRRRYRPQYGYAQSKSAILSWTLELDRRLRAAASPVQAIATHPGYAATGIIDSDMTMARNPVGRLALWLGNTLFAHSAADGAWCSLYAAASPAAVGGDYIGPDGLAEMRGAPRKVGVAAHSRDPDTAGRLWAQAAALTGVDYLAPAG